MTYPNCPQHMLREALSRNPTVSLTEIRSFHPAFRTMSPDRLSVTLSRALDDVADERGK